MVDRQLNLQIGVFILKVWLQAFRGLEKELSGGFFAQVSLNMHTVRARISYVSTAVEIEQLIVKYVVSEILWIIILDAAVSVVDNR